MIQLVNEQMSPIVIFIFIIAAIMIVISFVFSKKNKITKELQKTRKKKIAQVKQHEYVKLIGRAKGGDTPLIAPLSGRKCLCYYVIVEQKINKNWHSLIEEERFQDFILDNQGEIAIIKPARTHFEFRKTYFEIDHSDKSGAFNDAKPHLERFLKKHNNASEGFLGFNKNLRYKEGIIALDETIAVKGIATWKTTKEPIDGYSYSRILTLRGTDDQKLIITDYSEALKPVKRKL